MASADGKPVLPPWYLPLLPFTYLSLIYNTPNGLSPACGHTGSFLSGHQDKTEICRRNNYCQSPSLLYRSCFGREDRRDWPSTQLRYLILHHSDMDEPKGSSTRLLPLPGLSTTSLCWGKPPCQVPCKQPFVTNILGHRGT